MKRIVPIIRATTFALLLISFSYKSFSQSITLGNGKTEIGLGLGPLIFLGDLGGARGVGRTFVKDIDYPLTKLSKGVFLNVTPNEWLGFRIAANFGVLDGNDKEAPNKGGDEVTRLQRNLNFKTNLAEFYAATEFYPTVFLEKYDGLKGKLRPYGIIGVGVYHFNPKTQDNAGNWVALQPLHTEGEGFAEYPDRKEYKLTQLEIPMGFGVKYYLKENMFIGIEILHRKLFTDYVDDVSTNYIDPSLFDKYLTPQNAALAKELNYRGTYAWANTRPGAIVGEKRGDPTQNDAYFSTIIRLGWRLNSNPGSVRQLRCPKFY
ncbi:MAG TPA: DUF6089 family protein [Chitinophagaceae bacterium]